MTDQILQTGWKIFLLAVIASFYFTPTIVGFVRKHQSLLAIFVVNIFTGWTFVGWFVALVWSCTAARPQQVNVVVNQVSNSDNINLDGLKGLRAENRNSDINDVESLREYDRKIRSGR